jgi:citronellol/citronellal dehydrogenase
MSKKLTSLKGKTVFITGASRGIGLAIALACAREGANIVIAAKTTEQQATLQGTIYTAAEECVKAGGKALPVPCDVRFEDQIQAAVNKAVETFGGIDICVNNASAIHLKPVEDIDMKRYDLMHQINARGTFLVTKLCLPHLKKSSNPHVLMLSAPLEMKSKWFMNHTGYTMAKYGMSMCVLGMAEEFRKYGIAVNALWPLTTISTDAVKNLLGGKATMSRSRKPAIMADAAVAIFKRDCNFTGNFTIDQLILEEEGVKNFDKYSDVPGAKLMYDFFIPDNLMSKL